jgi:hypothetical protein
MFEYCKPGEKVLKSGIYRVKHADGCSADHEVTCLAGKVFPHCHNCGRELNFTLVRYAADAEAHPLFRPTTGAVRSRQTPKQHQKIWTDADLARLENLLAEGRTLTEAADELGRSEEALRERALKAGLQL